MAYSPLEHVEKLTGTITALELAKILGVSNKTVYKMVQKGRLPSLQLPGCTKLLFAPDTVATWLRRNNPSTQATRTLHNNRRAS